MRLKFYLALFLLGCMVAFSSCKKELNSNAVNSNVKVIGWKGADRLNKVLQDGAGNYYIIGSSNSFGNGDFDGLVVKVDAGGNMIWKQHFGGAFHDYFGDAAIDNNGNLIATGSTYSFGNPVATGAKFFEPEIYVVKMDADGNMIWQNSYFGGMGTLDYKGVYFDEGLRVCVDRNDNSIVIAGESDNFYRPTSTLPVGEAAVAFFLKISEHGDRVWDNNYVYNPLWSTCKGLIQLSNGNFLGAVQNMDFQTPVSMISLNRSSGSKQVSDLIKINVASSVTLWDLLQREDGSILTWGGYLNQNNETVMFLKGYDQSIKEQFNLTLDAYGFDNIVINAQGYFITAAEELSSGPVVHLTKMDKTGNIVWKKDVPSGVQSTKSFAFLSSENYILLFGNLINPITKQPDLVIYKLNEDGSYAN